MYLKVGSQASALPKTSSQEDLSTQGGTAQKEDGLALPPITPSTVEGEGNAVDIETPPSSLRYDFSASPRDGELLPLLRRSVDKAKAAEGHLNEKGDLESATGGPTDSSLVPTQDVVDPRDELIGSLIRKDGRVLGGDRPDVRSSELENCWPTLSPAQKRCLKTFLCCYFCISCAAFGVGITLIMVALFGNVDNFELAHPRSLS